MEGCRFGRIPVLEFGGNCLSESTTIGRFLAKKFNLVGTDDFDSAMCDEIVEDLNEMYALWLPVYFAGMEEKPGIMANVIPATIERYFKKFEPIIKKNGGHVVGKRLTWADIWLAHHISNLEGPLLQVKLTQNFPAIKTLIRRVFDQPKIREWNEKRPYTLC